MWGRRALTDALPVAEKMVTSEALDGVPVLVLANKQDVEVSLPLWGGSRSSGGPTSLGGCLPWARTAPPAMRGTFSPLGGGHVLSCSLETQGVPEKGQRGPRVGSSASPTPRTGGIWGGTETVLGTTSQPCPLLWRDILDPSHPPAPPV